MPALSITPNIDLAPWADLADQVDVDHPATIDRVGLLPDGMKSGDPSFEMVVRLADGSLVSVKTSWRLMRTALRSLDVSPIAPKLQDRP